MGFFSDTFGGIFSGLTGIFKSSDKAASPEDRAERYQKWQQELVEHKSEQKKIERRIFEVQKLLSRDPSNTALNKKMRELTHRQAKIAGEMSKINNNLYLHKA